MVLKPEADHETNEFSISGMVVDLIHRLIFPGTVSVANGKIVSVIQDDQIIPTKYILPGFIDAHIHIESSMLIPSEFARLAVVHGTVATVSDPHEIGNILGLPGVRYMIQNGKKVPFNFFFGAPSCVPATEFETSGASIGAKEIRSLFVDDGLLYLSEMMNFPGVLAKNPEVMEKIQIALSLKKTIDGHAPGLFNEEAKNYIDAGISTDHECVTLDEALGKVEKGMHIIIREGSAAKNFEALHPLLKLHPEKVMFCSDDKHPHELVEGHINQIVKRAIVEKEYEAMDVLQAACVNPIHHYGLDVGLLRPGDSADFIIVNNLKEFNVLQTYIKGSLVASSGTSLISSVEVEVINHFEANFTAIKDFSIVPKGTHIKVIEVIEGELITHELQEPAKIEENNIVSDISRDNLKLTVVNRYSKATPSIGFIRNFGLKNGAIASSVAHDSHNIIAVGTTDKEICKAVNALMENKGGIAVVNGEEVYVLPLPIAGIMSAQEGYVVAKLYSEIDAHAKQLGTQLQSPFMTLSFMALLVLPTLKLSDKGLFDGKAFCFTDVQVE